MKSMIAASFTAAVLSLYAATGAGAAMQCYDCHGTSGTSDYRPDDAAYRNISTGGVKGNHRTHMGSAATPGSCAACHGAGAAAYTNSHRNGQVNMAANINTSPASGSYSRGTSFAQGTNPALGTCSNVNCHFETATPAWNAAAFAAPADCNRCHGAAPATGSHPTTGTKHAAYYGTDSASCAKCHPDHANEGTPFAHATSAGKRNLAVSFAATPNSGSGAYSGALNDYLPSQTNTFGNCSATYCHSPGNKASGFDAPNTAATWGGGLACNGCHQGDKAGTNDPMASGSHAAHVDGTRASIKCVKCHAATATAGMAIADVSNHVNKQVNVAFNNSTTAVSGLYDGTPSPMLKAPGSAYGQCANTYCHGTTTPQWGGAPMACNSCHSAKANDAYWASNSAHKLHWEATTLPSDYAVTPGNSGAAATYQFACSSCHSSTLGAVHVSGPAGSGSAQVYFGFSSAGRKGTYTTGAVQGTTDNGFAWTAGGNCTTTYCHSNGAGGNGNTAVTWSSAVNSATNVRCKSCHSYTTASGSAMGTGSHGKHVSGSTYGMSCAKCHSGTTSDGASIADKTKHVNKAANVAWDAANSDGSAYADPNCTNIYCHSPGTKNAAAYTAPNQAAAWGGSLGVTCTGCHKGDKASADAMATGGHAKHVGNFGIDCVRCHKATVTGTRAIGTYSNHVNKLVNIAFNSTTTAVIGTARYNGTIAPMTKTPGTAYGQCTNVYCHSTVQGASGVGAPTHYGTPAWGASTVCSGCHREAGGHPGSVAADGSSSPIATGSHTKHLSYGYGLSGSSIKCVVCHKWDAGKTLGDDCANCHGAPQYAKHVNFQVDVAFDSTFGTGAYNGTPKPGDGYSNCANTYCHSNGTSVATASVPANTTVNWGTAGPLSCDACHGNPPAYASNSPKKNSHSKHNYACNICHSATTSNGTTISAGGLNVHVNRVYNVVQGGTATFTYTYNAAGGSCASISCHGGNSATWGATLKCQDCHLSTSDTDNYTYNDGTTAKVKNAGEWDTTGHGKASGTYTSGNAAAAFTAANACLYCHESGVSHGDGTNVFRLKNFAHATWGKNGVCMSCHVTGSAGVTVDSVLKNGGKKVSAYHYGADHTALKSGGQFCWDCHDPHGDTNVYMVQKAVAKVSNGTTAVPTTTANVTFTAFATGTDYAGANATKLCNACHTTASHYAGASGDGHNSGFRCTGCHSHNNSDDKTYGFQAGESGGGTACGACHNDLFNSDQSKYSMHSNIAGISYKHYLDNDAATYSTVLPNGPATNLTARKCTMCHVDHDIFRVNATATAGRAFNLRPNASVTPTAGTNTDLTNCVSCHYQVSTKAIAAPNAEDDSMPIPFPGLTFANATSIVKNSTHGYVVASQEFADATRGNTTFYANCTKCHNDTIGKNNGAKSSYNAQDGTQPNRSRFGNHMTTNNNYYSVFSNAFFQGIASSATNVTNATITVTGAGWTANQWTGYYVVTTGGTGQNQRKMVTSNTATVLTLAGTFTTALDGTTQFDIVQSPISTDNICFACHSKRGQGKGNRAGFDWYSSEHMKPGLEGIKDVFVLLGDTGTVSTISSGPPVTATISGKSWTADQWAGYTAKFGNGVVRKIISNTSNVLTLTYNKRVTFSVPGGATVEIFKPSYHPLDLYGRHDSIERVAPAAGTWNQGDGGKLSAVVSTTQVKDDNKYWTAGQWNGYSITFPKQGVTSTISSVTLDANDVPTITFSPAVSGLAANDPYYIGTRHVSCADCHNSHAAQPYPFGDVTTVASAGTSTLQADDAKNPTGARKWVDNQWTGYLLRVRSASTNLEQIRYITGYNSTTGTFTVGLPWNTAIAAGDDFWVVTSTKWSSVGQDGGQAGSGSAGVWGVTVGGFATPAAGSFQGQTGLTYTKVENVYDRTGSRGGSTTAGQRDMCVRCHSYYAFGTKLPTTPTPGPIEASTAAVGPVLATDVVQEFNPKNASHHAVYARGNNQPIRANYGQAGITSYMNPSWPIYATGNAGDTVTINNGVATFAGTAALPRTVLPGWYIYVGSDTRTAATGAVGAATTGYLEITSIISPTQFTVRAENGSGGWVTNVTRAAVNTWYVTAGLGNAFVPPYGPWSVLLCTDCHGSTKTDPLGPHASANDWMLKSLDSTIKIEWFDGANVTTVDLFNGVTATHLKTNLGNQIMCWNCHRKDVYGHIGLHGPTGNPNQSRYPHTKFWCSSETTTPGATQKLEGYPSTALPPGWQMWCKHCHGGDKVGGSHGTNITFTGGANGITAATPKKRFLNGATWSGYGKPDTATPLYCYTQASNTGPVSSCNKHSAGDKSPGVNANYNYW